MLGLFIDIASLAVIVLLVLWGTWTAVKYFWPSAEASLTGQFVGKLTDTTQAYTIYGLLETMKLDNKVKEDANALGAIAYLQSVALRGVAKDWTTPKPRTYDSYAALAAQVKQDEADAAAGIPDPNAESVTWEPKK